MRRLLKIITRFIPVRWQSSQARGTTVQPGSFLRERAFFLQCCFLFIFGALAIRGVCIHLFPPASKSLTKMASRQYLREHKFARYRGTIFDRRQEPLAISIRTPSIFVNPRVFSPTWPQIVELSRLLDIKRSTIKKISKRKKYFAWVKRKASKDAARKIKAMKIDGLYQISEPARYYPGGDSAANLLGFVGMDDKGLAGIERQFDKTLGGEPIRFMQSRDAKGHVIYFQPEGAAPESAGHNIYLTIDKAIQEITETALEDGIKTARAKGGFAIVSDPHTGKILAMANQPNYNPNDRSRINIRHTKNHAIMNAFEPGSVIKPFIAAAGLDAKKIKVHDRFDCEKGKLKIGRRTIHDSHKPETQFLSVSDIIIHSSNVCTYKIADHVGKKNIYNYLKRLGFGQNTSLLGFPGETRGVLSHYENWRPIRFANIAFGQGLMINGLQLMQAYGAIANGGKLLKPQIIDRTENSDGKVLQASTTEKIADAMQPDTARKLREILYQTIEQGAIKAKMEHFTAGGKTGTSQKIDPKTRAYSHTMHLSSFVGITPINDPHLVIYVQIDEPRQTLSYGSLWAAPVFKAIAANSLKYLNVAPDRETDKKAVAKKQKHRARRHVKRL